MSVNDHVELREFIANLPGMGEDELIDAAAGSLRRLGWRSLVLSGACVSELLKRSELRLPGGRAKKDASKRGLQARLKDLADNLGAGVSTLRMNARVFDTFFANEDLSSLARENCLPREFYVIALKASDPKQAIIGARARRAEGPYTRRQFRSDVSACVDAGASRTPHSEVRLRIPISAAANAELERLCALGRKTKGDVIDGLLLESASRRGKRLEKKDARRALLTAAVSPALQGGA